MSDIIIPITPDSSAPPSQPLRGVTRMVKLIQTMVGWRWCIWISPYTFQSEVKPGEMGPCRRVAVLMDPGSDDHPEQAQIALWTVPAVVLGEHTPQAPINW
jgi:hypothetical protein